MCVLLTTSRNRKFEKVSERSSLPGTVLQMLVPGVITSLCCRKAKVENILAVETSTAASVNAEVTVADLVSSASST